MPTARFKIVTVGLTPRAHATLESLLQKNAPPAWSLVDDTAAADIGIVDLDAENSKQLFDVYRARFSGPTLTLAALDPGLDDAIWVSKPVKMSALLAALGAAIERIAAAGVALKYETKQEPATVAEPTNAATTKVSQCVQRDSAIVMAAPTDTASADTSKMPASPVTKQSIADTNPRDVAQAAGMTQTERRRHPSYGSLNNQAYVDPTQRHLCFYDPEDYFQAALRRGIDMATSENLPVRIILGDVDKGISVFPSHDCVQSEVREHFLRSLSMVKGGNATTDFELLSAGTRPIATSAEPRLQTTSTLMWKVALWSAMGRIPIGSDPERLVELAYWPNFTRIFLPRHAIRIAALWSQHPMSLFDTATILNIEYRYVFSFYSAASATGAVTFAHGQQPSTTIRNRLGQQRFFGRLLYYLGSRD